MLANKRGITLVELLVTIGILSIVALIGVSLAANVFTSNQVTVEADQLGNVLRLAQTRSVSGYQDDVWGVHTNLSEYTLFKGSTYAGRDTAFDEVHAIQAGVEISGLTDVVFDIRTGATSNTGTITLTHVESGESKTISINENGRVTDL